MKALFLIPNGFLVGRPDSPANTQDRIYRISKTKVLFVAFAYASFKQKHWTMKKLHDTTSLHVIILRTVN